MYMQSKIINSNKMKFKLPEDMLKFLVRCLPHGFNPNGLNHS